AACHAPVGETRGSAGDTLEQGGVGRERIALTQPAGERCPRREREQIVVDHPALPGEPPPLARGYRGADRALQGGGVDGVNNAGLLAGGAFELEPEARRAGREQRRARAEHDRRDGKVIFVDQAEGGQGLRELAAAVDDDLLAGAGLQRVDALLEIAPEDAGIGPAWVLERGRDDDLFLLVDAPGDGIV